MLCLARMCCATCSGTAHCRAPHGAPSPTLIPIVRAAVVWLGAGCRALRRAFPGPSGSGLRGQFSEPGPGQRACGHCPKRPQAPGSSPIPAQYYRIWLQPHPGPVTGIKTRGRPGLGQGPACIYCKRLARVPPTSTGHPAASRRRKWPGCALKHHQTCPRAPLRLWNTAQCAAKVGLKPRPRHFPKAALIRAY